MNIYLFSVYLYQKMAVQAIAIDFGTTYSGYAFSDTIPGTHLKRVNLLTNQKWHSSTTAIESIKTPTCLLLSKNKTTYAFDYEAEEKYESIVINGKADQYYFFQRFKMELHNNQVIHKCNGLLL